MAEPNKRPRQYAAEILARPRAEWAEALAEVPEEWRDWVRLYLTNYVGLRRARSRRHQAG